MNNITYTWTNEKWFHRLSRQADAMSVSGSGRWQEGNSLGGSIHTLIQIGLWMNRRVDVQMNEYVDRWTPGWIPDLGPGLTSDPLCHIPRGLLVPDHSAPPHVRRWLTIASMADPLHGRSFHCHFTATFSPAGFFPRALFPVLLRAGRRLDG